MTDRNLPDWRSILFVPVLNERFIGGAAARGTDCIQLDPEDAIPPEQKKLAREHVAGVAARLSSEGCDIVVRINRPGPMAVADIQASVSPSVRALTLPEVPHKGHIGSICEILDEVELEKGWRPATPA